MRRLKKNVRGILRTGNMDPWDEVAARLNRLLAGWSNYFSYGSQTGVPDAVLANTCRVVLDTS